jgi:hypothetical protein
MNMYVLGGTIYNSQGELHPFQARVNAPNLHWARRLLLQDILGHNVWVKEMHEVPLEEQENPPTEGQCEL